MLLLDPAAARRADTLLAAVSRSFYFSLKVLPAAVRPVLSVAYLVARAADTIADSTALASANRSDLLRALRDAISGATSAKSLRDRLTIDLAGLSFAASERQLLDEIDVFVEALAIFGPGDRERTAAVLAELITGMERDLARFSDEESALPRPLSTFEEFDEHLYLAAGCVGAYWSRTIAAHVAGAAHMKDAAIVEQGVRLGKALQLVNVIRDLRADLSSGRCYLPQPLLDAHRIWPAELRTASPSRIVPLLDELRARALAHVDAAWPWILALPATEPRLRLAALWPLWIALGTLAHAGKIAAPLERVGPIKIRRRELHAILAESAAVVAIDPLLAASHRRRRANAAQSFSPTLRIAGDAPAMEWA